MAVNTQFSIAVHIMAGLGYSRGAEVCSEELARSVNANPSFLRRILSKLAKADLVKTSKGKGGACALARPANRISLLEIYRAVDAPKAFAIHAYPAEKKCKISCNIKSAMDQVLSRAQASMELGLEKMSLAEVIADLKQG